MRLSNKIVFITGAASGIGAACATMLVENGAKVVIADIDEKKGKKLAENLNKEYEGKGEAIFVKCDVTNDNSFKDAFKTAVSTFKQVDIMMNNAGVLGENHWENLINVNLKGLITGTEIALTHMRKDKGGQGGVIINVASQLGYTPVFFFPVYSATKHAVIGYTRSLATSPDLSAQGVRFGCICPDKTDTPIFQHLKPTSCREGYYEHLKQQIAQDLADPKEIAKGLLSLIEDDDSNGTLLEVSFKQGMVRKKITVEDA